VQGRVACQGDVLENTGVGDAERAAGEVQIAVENHRRGRNHGTDGIPAAAAAAYPDRMDRFDGSAGAGRAGAGIGGDVDGDVVLAIAAGNAVIVALPSGMPMSAMPLMVAGSASPAALPHPSSVAPSTARR